MFDMFDDMALELNRISFIPHEEVRKIAPMTTRRKLQKGELFLSPGDSGRTIAFVSRGLLKNFYSTSDGREYISSFQKEGDFAAAYFEILHCIPSRRYIQALEDTEILVIDYDNFSRINAGSIYWADLIRKVIEGKFAEKENKERDLMLSSAEERYHKFKSEHANLAVRIPQNQIALYLGINPSTLSRIKKKLIRAA
ncbi:MAG: Crp/Fnr family transcriptional regulator [Bacteriovoracaceae bacterium]|nr:Crp/Fnr family transcriptional regulator [Bacteriovoracaceae bacterium]